MPAVMSVAAIPPKLWRYTPPTAMLSDLTAFVQDHQAHGQLVGDASEPGPSGTWFPITVLVHRFSGVGWGKS